ncbi:MAG: hypothetical protein J6S23_00615 [Clostridia bacterium]|nr:hypothetical protein [Clostridia bacterium]
MELTVYRQSSKTRADGTIVYKGEDARPYVDGQIIFVADGLGGAAAIRHQKIVPELFDSEKLMDALFAGVYEDYSNEVFVNYVKESFFELFAVKDCYTDNINNIKKSGYFASRIVTAIILHEMLYSENCNAEKVFSTLFECENEEAKKSYVATLGKHFKELIQTKIQHIAKNANLIYESSYSGLALLGSTICATIYLEQENSVEAIYLTAGDSRPYVWSEKNGLCQVLEDQEGKDGGMTNYIKANDNAEFDIRCDYFSFEKPCVLFNASDGCFDSGKFISQLAFEKTILEGAISSDDTEKMSEYLTSFFLDYGRHDDSSTIAMKIFGYESFEDFKAACLNRMSVLNAEYFDGMSDLLDVDYISAYEEYERTFPSKLASLKEKFSSEQGVIDYCSDYIKEGKYAPYLDRINAINNKISSEKQRIDAAVIAISDVIAANYIKFKTFIDSNYTLVEKFSLSRIDGVENKYQATADDYISRIQRYKTEFDATVTTLTMLLNDVGEIGLPTSFDDYDEIAFQLIEDCEKKMDELFHFFNGLRSKKLDIIRKLTELRHEYIIKNKKLADKNPEDIKKLTEMVVSGKISVFEMDILEDEKMEIANELEIISEANATIAKMETEDKEVVFNESRNSYWERHNKDVILAVIDNPKYAIDDTLVNEAKTIINDFKEKIQSVKEKCEMQKALFEKYNLTYCMYIGGMTDDDTRI